MLETERLKLPVITEKDASFLYQLMNTPKWFAYIGDRKIRNEADALQYMEDRMHPDLQIKGFVNHVMTEKTSNQPVGTCSLHDREGVEGLDVGYALLPAFEGKGYAFEGARAMIDLAFNEHKQSKVSAITNETNKGSWRLLEKIGFKQQGYVQLPDVQEAIRLYVLKLGK